MTPMQCSAAQQVQKSRINAGKWHLKPVSPGCCHPQVQLDRPLG
jgi:hypothetical protein